MLLPSTLWRTRGQHASLFLCLPPFAMPPYRAVHHHAPSAVVPSKPPHTDAQGIVKAHPASEKIHRQTESARTLRRRIRPPTARKPITIRKLPTTIQRPGLLRKEDTRTLASTSPRADRYDKERLDRKGRALNPTFTFPQEPGSIYRGFGNRAASMQELRGARARRRLVRRHLPHSSQNPNGTPNVDEMDDDDYTVERDTGTILPELLEAKHLTTAVRLTAVQVEQICEAVCAPIQHSVAGLQKLLASYGPAGCTAISQSIATRMESLSQVRDLHIQAVKARDLLVELCHFYRGLVRAASGIPNDVDAAVYAVVRRKFLLEYHRYLIQGLAKEIAADVRDPILNAIPAFDAALLRERLLTLDEVIATAFPQIKIASGKLKTIFLIEVGGEGLGRLHAYEFWKSCQFDDALKILHRLKVRHKDEQLSRQYSISTTKALSIIDIDVAKLDKRLGAIIVALEDLSRHLQDKAAMAGRAGALEPFANSIRNKVVEWLRWTYQREYREAWRQRAAIMELQRWGYLPSPWCKKLWATPRSVRSERRSKLRAYIKGMSTQFHVTYHWTSGGSVKPWAHTIETPARTIETRVRKPRPTVNRRMKLKIERGVSLRKLRRLLSATLLSYQSRTIKSWRSVDRLASLPKTEKPSTSTQIGKTITALGFYDKVDKKGNDWPRKVEPLRRDSGEPVVRWSYSKAKPMRVPPQLRPRFQATQPMRTPHPTSISFSGDAWEQSVDVLTNPDTNGQRSLVGESSIYSLGGGTSDDQIDTKHPCTDSSGEQKAEYPNDPPDEQNPQSPNENMDKASNEDPPHESEQEEESESEADEDSDTKEPEEEHIPLTYRIPSDVLENALQAPPQTRASYWSQKLYRGPEDEELLLHYCVNMEVSERVAKHFLNEKVVGFDIEWKPFGSLDSIKENASLIQLATEDRIALFHIARFPGKTPEQLMPPTLKAVLESPDTYKVGVAVKGDCSRLEKYFGLNVRGVFELSRLHNLVEYYGTEPSKVNNKLVKLATQVHQHLLLPLHKGEPFVDEPQQRLGSVRESDWSRSLDFEQIHYAAADAYAGFRLFDVMESKRKKLKPTPPMPRLCDYDNKPAPRTTPRAKRAKKATPELEQVAAEFPSGLQAEDAEEEAYETAAEDFAKEEDNEDPDSESASESPENENPDADYVPKALDHITLGQVSAHRIGRVAFSRLTGVDPAYPTLPFISDVEDVSSDESEAFDPPPKAPRRRRVPKAARAAKVLPSTVMESDDEFPDPELEEAFTTMNLSEPLNPVHNPITEPPPQADIPDLELPTEQALVEEESPPSTDVLSPTFPSLVQPDTTTHTPEYTLATTWAQAYLSSTIPSPTSTAPSRIRATVSPLRAYHIWHHQRVPLDAIGAHLRDPPLAQSTVSNYILQAINMEKLEYRDKDLINLMGALPANLRLGKYGWLSRKLGIVR
ncbi:hypothetical protein P171DRAFT_434686 [Karstenula rhodostoma CBS 690.94]|uniref:3'-5' exonuclease domain-containing protein n=1 Tax=Karstenula rhodostoma CBS 690.94 TaxID=1392251 RepID=A0A9P4U7A2_9PLEO|nr:hypothetical protein P171DRAFT_434686 [Karstenula rhodostoma CBS 690.94]